jgi:murein L,D-transpeptidase YafK
VPAAALFFVVAALASAEPARVAAARAAKQEAVVAAFTAAGLRYPAKRVLLRAFKQEARFELWASSSTKGPLVLVKVYPICAASGTLGPKRKQGDLQVPEGFYRVDRLNPTSSYHLSLGIDYPNASDRVLGTAPLGGDIMIHGSCVTIGCIPLQDDPIEEVYLAVLDAGGKADVHVFPARLDTDEDVDKLVAAHPAHADFWRSLVPGYRAFEKTKTPPRVTVDAAGRYVIRSD